MKIVVLTLALSFGTILTVTPTPHVPEHPVPLAGPIGAPAPCAPCH